MPFDPYLVKITSLGVVFLLVLAFITYTGIRREAVSPNLPECHECDRDLDASRRSYAQKIEELNKEIRDKEIEIRILREKAGTPAPSNC